MLHMSAKINISITLPGKTMLQVSARLSPLNVAYKLCLITDKLQQKIHLWLSAPDPSSNHNDARKKRQPTTGNWFIDGEKFKQWKHDMDSFIWLHGIRTFSHDKLRLQ